MASWYEEILHAEPTLLGSLGAGLFHMALWLTVTSFEFGLAKHVDALMRTRFRRLYFDVIKANYETKDDLEMWGLQDHPEKVWVSYLGTALHHGTAGALMYLGMVWQSPWIWRHGLLTQLFGCDLLDFARVAWCLLLPPGPFPTCTALSSDNPGKFIGFISFHHTVSILAGLPVCIYFADQPDFQFMGVLLAGYPVFIVCGDTMSKCIPPAFKNTLKVIDVFMGFTFAYQRIFLYLPLAWKLLQQVHESQIPLAAKVSLAVGGLFMTLFNMMIVQMVRKNLKKIFSSSADESQSEQAAEESDVGGSDLHGDYQDKLPSLLRRRQPATDEKANDKQNLQEPMHSDSETTCTPLST
eukprot:TRINITY_DN4663_c0_g1_i2.p1 TRINITY_DN4663_c0_g1~~TRINITY_DN4663_c0_g1_i2.p1  ORF type:complete len:354 (+),score=53.93 TRINITY_DN4663_c0_g1_i2:158-1219(+)